MTAYAKRPSGVYDESRWSAVGGAMGSATYGTLAYQLYVQQSMSYLQARMVQENYNMQLSNARFAALGRAYSLTPDEKPCPYCGRKKQTVKHKSCDGCGAPK